MSDYHDLNPTAGPWKVDVIDNAGENWLVADMGYSADRETHLIITTDGVHATEMGDCDAATDAEFLVFCRNNWNRIVAALDGQVIAVEQKRLREWNAGLPLFAGGAS